MAYFDLRFAALIVINILKSQMAMPWEWDPFGIIVYDFTWTKFWLLTTLFVVFSFSSIQVPLTPPVDNMGYIRIQVKNYSVSLMVCFLASLFCPQLLFWYVYPIILLLFLCSTCLSNLWRSFVLSVELLLPTIPHLSIFIMTATPTDHELNSELHEVDHEIDQV